MDFSSIIPLRLDAYALIMPQLYIRHKGNKQKHRQAPKEKKI